MNRSATVDRGDGDLGHSGIGADPYLRTQEGDTRLKGGGEIKPIEADDFNPLALSISRMWTDDEVRWEFDAAYQDLVDAVRNAPDDACIGEGWASRYAERTAGSHYPEHLPDLQRLLDG